jgi:hypothetical protein
MRLPNLSACQLRSFSDQSANCDILLRGYSNQVGDMEARNQGYTSDWDLLCDQRAVNSRSKARVT